MCDARGTVDPAQGLLARRPREGGKRKERGDESRGEEDDADHAPQAADFEPQPGERRGEEKADD